MKRTQCALYDMIFLIELAFRKKLIRTNCPDTQNHRKVNCIQQYTLQTQIHTTNSLQKNDLHIVKTATYKISSCIWHVNITKTSLAV